MKITIEINKEKIIDQALTNLSWGNTRAPFNFNLSDTCIKKCFKKMNLRNSILSNLEIEQALGEFLSKKLKTAAIKEYCSFEGEASELVIKIISTYQIFDDIKILLKQEENLRREKEKNRELKELKAKFKRLGYKLIKKEKQ